MRAGCAPSPSAPPTPPTHHPPHPTTPHTQVFLTPDYLALAMEYAPGGDLFRYVSARRGLSEEEARWFFQQLIVAIDYCHRMVSVGAGVCGGGMRVMGRAVGGWWAVWERGGSRPAWGACVCARWHATRPPLPPRSSHTHTAALLAPPRQGVTSRDIKLENTLLDGSPRPLIKVRARACWRG